MKTPKPPIKVITVNKCPRISLVADVVSGPHRTHTAKSHRCQKMRTLMPR